MFNEPRGFLSNSGHPFRKGNIFYIYISMDDLLNRDDKENYLIDIQFLLGLQ